MTQRVRISVDKPTDRLLAADRQCTLPAGYFFYRDVFGGWRWEFGDCHGEVRDSPYSFDTQEECVLHAQTFGIRESHP